MIEAKAKDQGHKRKCSTKKKIFTKIFQAISTKKRFPNNFSSALQNFNNSKNTAVLEPRTGQFSRTWGLEAKDVLEDSTSVNYDYTVQLMNNIGDVITATKCKIKFSYETKRFKTKKQKKKTATKNLCC